jgi:hypothetical protein
MEGYPTICSGATMGTVRGMRAYLNTFLEVLEQQLQTGTEAQKQNCRHPGVDQGLHNYVVYSGKLSDLSIMILANGEWREDVDITCR